jgi:hypothetical protein
MTIIPDDKDWTWILERPCPECHFSTASLELTSMAEVVLELATAWQRVVLGPEVRKRPSASTWSPLEYSCHVRDVFSLYATRLRAMIANSGVAYPNWDQDAAAIALDYEHADPVTVARELDENGRDLAHAFATVDGDLWGNLGTRSDGKTFTIATFAQYFAHDPIHHLYDVGSPDVSLFVAGSGAGR